MEKSSPLEGWRRWSWDRVFQVRERVSRGAFQRKASPGVRRVMDSQKCSQSGCTGEQQEVDLGGKKH